MAGNEIGAEGVKALAEVLPRCANLSELDLASCRVQFVESIFYQY